MDILTPPDMPNAPGSYSARCFKFRDHYHQLRPSTNAGGINSKKSPTTNQPIPKMKTIQPSQRQEHDGQPHKAGDATAIQSLSCEHRHIETVIKSLQDAVAALDARQRLNVQKLLAVVEFLRVYADQRHHQREEGIFFPLLVRRGVPPQGCPIGGLNNEHEKGRALVSVLDEGITSYE